MIKKKIGIKLRDEDKNRADFLNNYISMLRDTFPDISDEDYCNYPEGRSLEIWECTFLTTPPSLKAAILTFAKSGQNSKYYDRFRDESEKDAVRKIVSLVLHSYILFYNNSNDKSSSGHAKVPGSWLNLISDNRLQPIISRVMKYYWKGANNKNGFLALNQIFQTMTNELYDVIREAMKECKNKELLKFLLGSENCKVIYDRFDELRVLLECKR